MQQEIVGIALDLLDTARHPRTTLQTPFNWDATGEWRGAYMKIVPNSGESDSSKQALLVAGTTPSPVGDDRYLSFRISLPNSS